MDFWKLRKTIRTLKIMLSSMENLMDQYQEGKLDIDGEVLTFPSAFKTALVGKYNVLKMEMVNKFKELP